MLWVHVYSGLMSRCCTLAEAYYLVKHNIHKEEKALTIIWPVSADCGIHYYDVFARDMFQDINIRVIEVVEGEQYYCDNGGVISNIRKKRYLEAFRAVLGKSAKKIRKYIVKIQIVILKIGKNIFEYHPPGNVGWSGDGYLKYAKTVWCNLKNELGKNRNIYIHAYCGIIKDGEKDLVDYSVIKFKEEYNEEVNQILPRDENFVGIHIRRTDHDVAIENSSTKAFAQAIEQVIAKQKDSKFFLATDDIGEEQYLKRKYGDKIIVQSQKAWGRTNRAEMRSGIIDCLCLSRCDYILGSYTSVFSWFAAKFGKKELIVCKDE